MSMVVIVTRDVPDRFRGFLASCMLEIAPGIYTAPGMSAGVRERAWAVLSDWFGTTGGGSLLMTWKDDHAPGGQGLKMLGHPQQDFAIYDDLVLIRREVSLSRS